MGHIIEVDKGFYQEARRKGVAPLTYLTQQVNPEPPEVQERFTRLCRRFRQADDGSTRAQMVWQFAYDLTGLEKELEHRGHCVKGVGSEKVDKVFFSSANDTALFPAFLASQVIAGILATSLVPFLTAAEERINSHVAEKITINDTASHRTLRWIGEGVDLPKTKILRTDASIKLYKYGRMLEASYESIRLMKVDIFGLMLQRMGMQIGIDQTDDLIETLIAGDGTTGSALTDTDAEVTGTFDYDELIRLRLAFPIGYEMQHCITNDTQLRAMLNMPEFKDPTAGFNFQRTGQFVDALGSMWHRWTSTGSASFSTDRILAVDSRGAAILVREGDLLEESDQLIDKQLHQRTMSEWCGFMKWDVSASQCLDIS